MTDSKVQGGDVSAGGVASAASAVSAPLDKKSMLAVMHAHMGVAIGGPLCEYAPAFSNDNKQLFCCAGNIVKVYSTITSEQVGIFRGHAAPVTGVLLHPGNPSLVLTCSLDGTVRCWNPAEFLCVETFKVGAAVLHMTSAKRCQNMVYLNVNPRHGEPDGDNSCLIGSLSLESTSARKSHDAKPQPDSDGKQPQQQQRRLWKQLYGARNCTGLAVTSDGEHLASISARTLFVYSLKTRVLLKHHHVRPLHNLAFHPTDSYLATGDAKGQILLWYKFHAADVVTSVLHWHAHAVASLAFTEDGAYLLSGGEEAVLVFWQLDTGHRQYVPRLGGTITAITVSPDGNRYALACFDNAIRLVDAVSSKVVAQIQGLQHARASAVRSSAALSSTPHVPRSLMSELVVEPRHRLLVLPGAPGAIQFYDVYRDRHVSELEIVHRNFVSRVDDEHSIPTRIERVAFNRDGRWMATVERRAGASDETTEVLVLKIWRLDEALQQYQLNTRINAPHKGRVTALKFHPNRDLLVTASADNTFKVWTLTERTLEPVINDALRRARDPNAMDVDQKEARKVSPDTLFAWRCDGVSDECC